MRSREKERSLEKQWNIEFLFETFFKQVIGKEQPKTRGRAIVKMCCLEKQKNIQNSFLDILSIFMPN